MADENTGENARIWLEHVTRAEERQEEIRQDEAEQKALKAAAAVPADPPSTDSL